MRVRIGKPRRWISPYNIADWICFWEDKNSFTDDESLSCKLGDWLCESKTLNRILDWYNKRPENNISVRLDRHDTWSIDRTLAHVIVPMLKQLRESKHGSPLVDDDDVPEELKTTSAPPLTEEEKNVHALDANWFKRWDWALDEMIWAFEQYTLDDDWASQFYSGKPDFQFIDIEGSDNKKLVDGPNNTFKIDREGLEKHKRRMENGRRLFAKYYEGLWD